MHWDNIYLFFPHRPILLDNTSGRRRRGLIHWGKRRHLAAFHYSRPLPQHLVLNLESEDQVHRVLCNLATLDFPPFRSTLDFPPFRSTLDFPSLQGFLCNRNRSRDKRPQ